MDLIKNLYDMGSSNERPKVLVRGDAAEKFSNLLESMHSFNCDLYYPQVMSKISWIFWIMKCGANDTIRLNNLRIGSSRFSPAGIGSVTFDYSINYNESGLITYYSCDELFYRQGFYTLPVITLSNQDTTLYYSIGSGFPAIMKYDIKLNDNFVFSRQFSSDEITFKIEGNDNSLDIRIKSSSKILDNELEVVEYLKRLTYPYDILEIYNNLCEISLGKSYFDEIALCESKKIGNDWNVINSVSIKDGEIDSIIRTIGDKTISCEGNDNWSYTLSDENICLSIVSGNTISYIIQAKNDKAMDEYTDTLLKYDVSKARSEVEDTKNSVREKCRVKSRR